MILAEEKRPEVHEARTCFVGDGEPSSINHEEFMAACESAWEEGRRVVIQDFRSDQAGRVAVSPQ